MSSRADLRGFTLIELLVALAIFAVMATLAFGGLGEAVTQSERLDGQQQRWRSVQRAVRLMENDFAQLRARPVRGILGQDHEPALQAFGAGELSFTRGGWLNPGLLPRAELQRVRYRLIDGRLLREFWPVLDRIGATQSGGEVLLAEVEAFRVEFLPEPGAAQAAWMEFWPPPGEFSVATLPAGVRITVVVPGIGTVARLIEVGR
ncbi:MAG: type II secretion system minor pseudopilin GspJ [Gammaproteobacteria bacterium]|nr:type II secretion system minor pseudopilin GspJ [Gammaproteobacteria bacterium]